MVEDQSLKRSLAKVPKDSGYQYQYAVGCSDELLLNDRTATQHDGRPETPLLFLTVLGCCRDLTSTTSYPSNILGGVARIPLKGHRTRAKRLYMRFRSS